jgi:CheY-like chemotaxis protein
MNADSREETVARPRLIVAHADAAYVALVSRAFRRLGWDVHSAATGPEARRLARQLAPEVLVLAAELEGESGWLTCHKVLSEQPRVKVFLVGDNARPGNGEFAHFVGAVALLPQSDSVQTLVADVCGRSLPAAG